MMVTSLDEMIGRIKSSYNFHMTPDDRQLCETGGREIIAPTFRRCHYKYAKEFEW